MQLTPNVEQFIDSYYGMIDRAESAGEFTELELTDSEIMSLIIIVESFKRNGVFKAYIFKCFTGFTDKAEKGEKVLEKFLIAFSKLFEREGL